MKWLPAPSRSEWLVIRTLRRVSFIYVFFSVPPTSSRITAVALRRLVLDAIRPYSTHSVSLHNFFWFFPLASTTDWPLLSIRTVLRQHPSSLIFGYIAVVSSVLQEFLPYLRIPIALTIPLSRFVPIKIFTLALAVLPPSVRSYVRKSATCTILPCFHLTMPSRSVFSVACAVLCECGVPRWCIGRP